MPLRQRQAPTYGRIPCLVGPQLTRAGQFFHGSLLEAYCLGQQTPHQGFLIHEVIRLAKEMAVAEVLRRSGHYSLDARTLDPQ
jgi:hypothetical protein